MRWHPICLAAAVIKTRFVHRDGCPVQCQERAMVAMRESKVPRGRDRGHHNSPMRDDLAVRVKGGATEALHSVRQGVRSAAKQVRQTASEVTGALRTTLHEEADELYQRHKGTATSQVKRFGKIAEQTAHALHAVKADNVAEYLDQ